MQYELQILKIVFHRYSIETLYNRVEIAIWFSAALKVAAVNQMLSFIRRIMQNANMMLYDHIQIEDVFLCEMHHILDSERHFL